MYLDKYIIDKMQINKMQSTDLVSNYNYIRQLQLYVYSSSRLLESVITMFFSIIIF